MKFPRNSINEDDEVIIIIILFFDKSMKMLFTFPKIIEVEFLIIWIHYQSVFFFQTLS